LIPRVDTSFFYETAKSVGGFDALIDDWTVVTEHNRNLKHKSPT